MLGRILLFLVGVLAIGGSIYSLYIGHISIGRFRHHVYYRAADPHTFWFYVILYAIIGVFLIFTSFRSPDE